MKRVIGIICGIIAILLLFVSLTQFELPADINSRAEKIGFTLGWNIPWIVMILLTFFLLKDDDKLATDLKKFTNTDVGFLSAIQICFKKYFDFTGVAARPEFWWFQLFYFILVVLGITLDGNWDKPDIFYMGPWEVLFYFGLFIPAVSVGCRRLHDIDKSGWWQLLYLTVIGIILLIMWWCKEGTPSNKYRGYLKK
tara:strand:- start:1533 stop:2120 length:588 start_codon:yes stop_codon:yes gene_type:complete